MTPPNAAPPNGPTRTDLTYLRRRTRPKKQQAPAASSPGSVSPAPSAHAAGSPGGSVADFLSGRSTRPGRQRQPPRAPAAAAAPQTPRPAAAPAARGGGLDLGASSAPSVQSAPSSGSLDLGSSGAPPTSPRPPASSGSSLDLGSSATPAPASRPQSSSGSSLDLGSSATPASTPAPASRPQSSSSSLDLGASSSLDLGLGGSDARFGSVRHVREKADDLRLPVISEHERRVLGATDRVVHLTRMQSAVGRLRFEPALGAGEHLDLGCALETSDRQESIVLGTLNRQGPDPRRPMVRCGGHGAEIDLRRIHSLSRLLIVAVGGRLPGGTLVVTTYGGSRMEIPLRNGPTLGAQALLTGYVVQGRLVLRAELDPFSGTLQQVCGAYGYTELTWRDPGTPLI